MLSQLFLCSLCIILLLLYYYYFEKNHLYILSNENLTIKYEFDQSLRMCNSGVQQHFLLISPNCQTLVAFGCTESCSSCKQIHRYTLIIAIYWDLSKNNNHIDDDDYTSLTDGTIKYAWKDSWSIFFSYFFTNNNLKYAKAFFEKKNLLFQVPQWTCN